jgi:ankyrin repeat protein
MAPEQFRGAAVIASDLYGLGATILYVLTHRSPADLPQSRLKLVFRDRVNISDRFADWLEKILEPEPVDRFASADIALNALQKQHQFRKQQGIKIGFPWKSAAAVAAILMISIPLIYQYRYGFLTTLGLPPRDLCTVIEKQDIKSLHEYLTHGVSINANVAISNDGRTGSLLHCALVYNQDVIVKDLLENGASLDSIDSNNKTPLIAAISARQLDLVKLLIAKGAEVNDRDSNGQTPLMATIFGGELDLVKLLIAKGAKVDNRDKDGQTPLIAAISGDKLDIVELLIAKSAKVNEQNKDGQTPLIAAISGGKLDIIELLIAKSAEVNGRNQDGQTPLIAAINNKNSVGKAAGVNEPNNGQIPPIALDLVKLLISKGAKVNDRNKDGQTPLIAAVFNSDPSIVKTLLSKGAEIDKKHSNNYPNQTPLTIAISRQEFDMVELLIAKGAGINERNKDGQTPLMVAIATGDNNRASEYSPQEFIKPEFKLTLDKNQAIPKTIELLLNRGADPNLRDINGDTALHFIGKLGNVYPAPVSLSGTCSQQRSVALYTLDLLMRHKVDRQATNKYGDTALHVLARKDFFPVTERMIRYGWDPSQKDRSGRNAFQLMNAAQPRESRCIKGSN